MHFNFHTVQSEDFAKHGEIILHGKVMESDPGGCDDLIGDYNLFKIKAGEIFEDQKVYQFDGEIKSWVKIALKLERAA